MRRKILMLLPFPPSLEPRHGGQKVMGRLAHGLAGRHEVALLYARRPGEEPADSHIGERCARVEEVEAPGAPTGVRRGLRRARTGLALLGGRPSLVSRWRLPGLRRRLRRLLDEWEPDVLQVEHQVMGQFLRDAESGSAVRVLTAHETGADAAEGGGVALPAWLGPIGVALERRAWTRYEESLLVRVDAVVAFTRRDCERLRPRGGHVELRRVPLGIDPPAEPAPGDGGEGNRILFFGSFRHPPNVEAARRLVRRILPLVRRQVPAARLDLVGESPPPDLSERDGELVSVTGFVPSIEPFLERAAVVAAPLRFGGGTRVKVIESLAAGKAVVATPLAVAGLDVRPGESVLLAEDDAQLAEAIAGLLEDADARRRLESAARRWASERDGWDAFVSAYEQLYEDLLGRDR